MFLFDFLLMQTFMVNSSTACVLDGARQFRALHLFLQLWSMRKRRCDTGPWLKREIVTRSLLRFGRLLWTIILHVLTNRISHLFFHQPCSYFFLFLAAHGHTCLHVVMIISNNDENAYIWNGPLAPKKHVCMQNLGQQWRSWLAPTEADKKGPGRATLILGLVSNGWLN